MKRIFWGDLHNHCAASYGQGTPALAIDNARRHLDFCTITGHAFWPDMPMDLAAQNPIVGMHLGGFAKLQYFWESLMQTLRAANRPGRFVTLPSYEWHSMRCGDYNCYAPDYGLELLDAPDVRALARRLRARRREFMLLPHHCGYPRGFRGLNWEFFDERVSPLIEIYSNHGCGEADDAPFDYHHRMGPRSGESMIRDGLAAGRRFGFYASTDSHDGYPGHYGHGRVGVWADKLESGAIWRSLKTRRTIATTGARIAVEMSAGRADIGGIARIDDRAPLAIRIEGTTPLDAIDLIEGGGGRWRLRRLPVPVLEPVFTPGRHKIKIEVGWGRHTGPTPWRVLGWIVRGKLRGIDGCFRYSTWDTRSEESSEMARRTSASGFAWECRSMSNPSGAMGGTHFNAGGTQAVILDVDDAGRDTRLVVEGNGVAFDVPVRRLAAGSCARMAGDFGSVAMKIHRAIPEREFATRLELPAYAPPTAPGFAYLRVRQTDGHTAWVSPIWFE